MFHINVENFNIIQLKRDLIFKKKFDYRLLTSELKKLSSNEFLVRNGIFYI